MRARRGVPVALCAVALVASGCGGSSNDDYKKDLKKAAEQFQTDAQSASTKLSGAQSPTDFSAGADSFKQAVTKFTDNVNKLDPPSDAKDAQNQLVKSLETFSGDLDDIGTSLQGKDVSKAQQGVQTLQKDLQGVQSSASTLESKVK